MQKKTRRIIFYIFLAIFLFLAPAITLYSLGYDFDFEEQKFVTTGAIYLKSYPSKADVYINNKIKGKTSKFIRRLIPKTYDVKIEKEEYHPWQKKLTVKKGLVTKADNILLVPFNPKIFLVATESNNYSLFFEKPYDLNKLTEIIKKKSKYTIFKIENPNFNLRQDKLYFLYNNNLYSLKIDKNDLENSFLSEILVPNVINFAMYKNGIIYLDYFTGKIFELNSNTLQSAEFFEQVFPGFDKGEWIVSNDSKKLLSKKSKSLEILWLENIIDCIDRKKGEIEKISFNEKINDAAWYPETDEHLIISTDNSILITELDSRTPRNIVNFITTEKAEIKYDSRDKILYFFSQNRLYQTEL